MLNSPATMDDADVVRRFIEIAGNARHGLPDEVFLAVSRLTPMINVDLLVKDSAGRTLLTWRDDDFYGPGWHVPGGIIRFKEQAKDRVAIVARKELGTEAVPEGEPLAIREIMHKERDVRGHFISLLYRCTLLGVPAPELAFSDAAPKHGHWRWHEGCPDNLIPQHTMYRPYIGVPL